MQLETFKQKARSLEKQNEQLLNPEQKRVIEQFVAAVANLAETTTDVDDNSAQQLQEILDLMTNVSDALTQRQVEGWQQETTKKLYSN